MTAVPRKHPQRDLVEKKLWQHRIINSHPLNAIQFAVLLRLAVVIPESSTTFWLLKRSRDKAGLQIRLEAEVRRVQETPEERLQ